MSSLVNKIKDAVYGGSDTPEDSGTGRHDINNAEGERGSGTRAQGSSHVPGSFPSSEQEGAAGRHNDGREYVPPQRTHVSHGQSGYQEPGSETRDGDRLMDPASRGTGSNVLGGEGAGVGAQDDHPGGHNKLHKPDGPRGYESGTSASALPASDQHQGQGQHLRENIIGSGDVPRDPSDTRHRYPDDIDSPQQHEHGRQHGQEHITGSSHPPRESQQTGQGYAGDTSSSYQQRKDFGDDIYSSHKHKEDDPARFAAAGAAEGTAVGGLASSQLPERSRYDDETSRQTTGANDTYGITARDKDQQNYAAADSSNRSAGGIYNTVVGHGSGEDPASPTGRLTDREHPSHPGVVPDQSGQNTIPREAGDSRITSGTTGAHGASSAHQQDPYASSTGHGIDASFNQQYRDQQHQYDNIHGRGAGTHHSTTISGLTGEGQGAMARDSPIAHASGAGTGAIGSPSDANVVHKCTACGHDNDISHYFKKDNVSRVDQ